MIAWLLKDTGYNEIIVCNFHIALNVGFFIREVNL